MLPKGLGAGDGRIEQLSPCVFPRQVLNASGPPCSHRLTGGVTPATWWWAFIETKREGLSGTVLAQSTCCFPSALVFVFFFSIFVIDFYHGLS